ncbi:putative transposase of IS4/5 family DUF4096 [Streptomyces sp. 2132.2]|nr:putative transposase of IS4/5 family DUF4096 [Streptomyces sp. 2132.2]
MDQGFVIRCHELTNAEWELPAPLIPSFSRGRPRSEDRRVINGMVYKIRTGVSDQKRQRRNRGRRGGRPAGLGKTDGTAIRHSRNIAPRGCRKRLHPLSFPEPCGHAHRAPEAAVAPCWRRRGAHLATPRKERGQARSVVEAPGSLLVGAVPSRVFLTRSPDSPRIGRRIPVCAGPRCFSRATTVLVHRSAPVRNGRGRLRLLVLIASTRIHGLRPPASRRHLTGPVPRARDFTPGTSGTSATRHLRVPEALLVAGDLTPRHAAHPQPRPPLRLYRRERGPREVRLQGPPRPGTPGPVGPSQRRQGRLRVLRRRPRRGRRRAAEGMKRRARRLFRSVSSGRAGA